MPPRVAVVQTSPLLGQVEANLLEVERSLAALAGRAELAVFPELFTTGYRREGMDHASLAEPVPESPTVRRLRAAAGAARVGVIGTLLEAADGRVYDTAVVIDERGEFRGRYRKTHLYPAERAFFSPGEALTVIETAGVRIGLAICFEHAFPEIFTALAVAGSQLIVIPSAVPVGYEYLLELRTRARAQDNQLYVAAANLVGFDGVTRWAGGSMLVDPRGSVLAAAGADAPGTIVAEISPDRIDSERAQEPALVNRRPELYAGSPRDRE